MIATVVGRDDGWGAADDNDDNRVITRVGYQALVLRPACGIALGHTRQHCLQLLNRIFSRTGRGVRMVCKIMSGFLFF